MSNVIPLHLKASKTEQIVWESLASESVLLIRHKCSQLFSQKIPAKKPPCFYALDTITNLLYKSGLDFPQIRENSSRTQYFTPVEVRNFLFRSSVRQLPFTTPFKFCFFSIFLMMHTNIYSFNKHPLKHTNSQYWS
jgi:hypothetical protein